MGVTPPHVRTNHNLFFLEGECLGSLKRMVVDLGLVHVVLKITFNDNLIQELRGAMTQYVICSSFQQY